MRARFSMAHVFLLATTMLFALWTWLTLSLDAFAGPDAASTTPGVDPQSAWGQVLAAIDGDAEQGGLAETVLVVSSKSGSTIETDSARRAFEAAWTDPSLAGKDGVEIPVEHPRGPFVHWVMVDLASELRSIAEGSASDGVTKGGKRTPPGPAGARQGLNDYTGWFAGDPDMAGDWFGYDGPYPPPNDLRSHRYFFRLFALDVAQLELPERFTAGDVQRAMQGHVLAEASVWGSYALHPQAQPA